MFNVENFKKLNNPRISNSSSFHSGVNAGSGYEYIDRLLLHPVKDGRHRLLWLVIAPYAANVLKLEQSAAVAMVEEYFKMCEELEPTDVSGSVSYYVERSYNEELMPPHLSTIEATDPDLFAVITSALGKISDAIGDEE